MSEKKKLPPFTPVFDSVVQDVGAIGALVYGVIWRHCQMRKGVCIASKDTMSELTGLGRRTIQQHLATLIDKGYVLDFTPNVRNKPHTYVTVNIDLGVQEMHTTDGEGVQNLPEGVQEIPGGVQQMHDRCAGDAHKDTRRRQGGDKEEGAGAPVTPPPAAAFSFPSSGNSTVDNLVSWFTEQHTSKGYEVIPEKAQAAARAWLDDIAKSGKSWRSENYEAIAKRYDLAAVSDDWKQKYREAAGPRLVAYETIV